MPKRVHDGLKKRCPIDPQTGKRCAKKNWSTCHHAWQFSFHHRGREWRFSLDVIAKARNLPPPRSKSEAETWRDALRSEIRGGTFVDPNSAPPAVAQDKRLTFGDVCETYLKEHVRTPTRRERGQREMEIAVKVLRRAEIPAAQGAFVLLETKPIESVSKADVEAVRSWRRREQAAAKSAIGPKGGEVGTNRLLSRLRHIFSWAIGAGYVEATPFKRGPVTVVRMEASVEGARTRRLEPSMRLPDGSEREGEEARLLKLAGPHLRALIVAALTTGARQGELLSIQWSQIRWDEKGDARWLVLPASKTKTAETRTVPIGPRLRAELEMRRHGSDGKEHRATAYVFGNEVGEQFTSIRTAWELTCERAEIAGLHFHDLRREFACRLLESGADMHDVMLFLGHANITTTSRYLQSTPMRLENALAKMERAELFAHHSHTDAKQPPSEAPKETPEKRPN